jgi:heterodisulfide reductase subunit B
VKAQAPIGDIGYIAIGAKIKKPLEGVKIAGSGTRFKMPVVYYSTFMAVAYGRKAKDAALNGQALTTKQREPFAAK